MKKTLILLLSTVLILTVLSGCDTQQKTSLDGGVETEMTTSADGVDFENRNQFEKYIEARFKELSAKFDAAKETVDADSQALITEGETQRAQFQVKWNSFKNASKDAWKELRSDLQEELADFEDATLDLSGRAESSAEAETTVEVGL